MRNQPPLAGTANVVATPQLLCIWVTVGGAEQENRLKGQVRRTQEVSPSHAGSRDFSKRRWRMAKKSYCTW